MHLLAAQRWWAADGWSETWVVQAWIRQKSKHSGTVATLLLSPMPDFNYTRDHIGRVDDKFDAECTGKNQVCRIGRHQNRGRYICHSKLAVNPSSWVFDIAGDASHIGEERSPGQDYRVVANEAAQGKKECVEKEK